MPPNGLHKSRMVDLAGTTATPALGRSLFDRMLVPIDFSPASRTALATALRIADRWRSEVVLFHAAALDENDEFLDHTGVPWGRGDVVGQAADHLRNFAGTVAPGSQERVRFDATRDEDTVRAVVRACARHAPSVMVLGVRRPGRRRLFRSRAERIVRAVPCPVFLVRAEEQEVRVDADM